MTRLALLCGMDQSAEHLHALRSVVGFREPLLEFVDDCPECARCGQHVMINPGSEFDPGDWCDPCLASHGMDALRIIFGATLVEVGTVERGPQPGSPTPWEAVGWLDGTDHVDVRTTDYDHRPSTGGTDSLCLLGGFAKRDAACAVHRINTHPQLCDDLEAANAAEANQRLRAEAAEAELKRVKELHIAAANGMNALQHRLAPTCLHPCGDCCGCDGSDSASVSGWDDFSHELCTILADRYEDDGSGFDYSKMLDAVRRLVVREAVDEEQKAEAIGWAEKMRDGQVELIAQLGLVLDEAEKMAEENSKLRELVLEKEFQAALGCEDPPADCECPGCTLAAKREALLSDTDTIQDVDDDQSGNVSPSDKNGGAL